ncbi:MAG: hypothetical protein Q7R96_03515 [Nanoarchaeota archaeon]|nr:hypothetical protein [Nanoarchaeota archaeon]
MTQRKYVLVDQNGMTYDLNEVIENGCIARAAVQRVLEGLDAVETTEYLDTSFNEDRETIEIGCKRNPRRGNIPVVDTEGFRGGVNLILARITHQYENPDEFGACFVAYDDRDKRIAARPARVKGVDLETVVGRRNCDGVLLTDEDAREGIPIEVPKRGGGYHTLTFRLIEEEKSTGGK